MKFIIFLFLAYSSLASDFTFESHGLDARFEGAIKIQAVDGQENKFYYNFTENIYLNGLEIYCYDSNKFDSVDMAIEYYAGLDGNQNPIWLRYKKFGKNYYVTKQVLQKNIVFPTTPKVGTRVAIKYNFGIASPLPANCFINLFKFADIEKVDPTKGEQGADW